MCRGSTKDFEYEPSTLCSNGYPDKSVNDLLKDFLASRRKGLSILTIKFYSTYLNRSKLVISTKTTQQDISTFLDRLSCTAGGRHAYFRALSAFYNWLYSPKSGYGLNPTNNPTTYIDPPLVEKKIMPSLTSAQFNYLVGQCNCLRDKCIVSLLGDSGLRLMELTNINPANIDWEHRCIKVHCKGNKEAYALFGERTEQLLKQWMQEYHDTNGLWNISEWGIASMLKRLELKTGIKCNAHVFRRAFASILARRNVDALHIMRLGRWQSLEMVQHYTASVKFDDSVKFYSAISTIGT